MMNDQKLFFKNFLIFSAKKSDALFPGSLLTENGKITEIYPAEEDVTIPDGCHIVEGNGRLLMPGLINSHSHIYSAFARGVAINPFSPTSFRQLLEQLWWRLDKALNLEDIYYSGILSGMDMLRNGVTTFIDHHASPNAVSGSLGKLVDACVNTLGLRGIFCYETSDRDGHQIARKGIEENLAAQKFNEQLPGKAAALLGLHASFTLEERTLESCSGYALPIHIHVAEGAEDAKLHRQNFGMTAISRLDKFGLLQEDSLLAHCLLVEDEDLKTIKKRNCRVVFNPQSNMNNGAGLPDYARFNDQGIQVNLGNDGYGFDLTRDMRTLLLSQHLLHKEPCAFGTGDLFDVVFRNNGEYASNILKSKIGKIEKGYRADLVIYNYTPPTPLTPSNFMDHYYFAIIENCKPEAVYIDGVPILEDGILQSVEEKKLTEACTAQCADFWKRF
jgi:putative selenium metabolism protein SsnA